MSRASFLAVGSSEVVAVEAMEVGFLVANGSASGVKMVDDKGNVSLP